MTFEDLYEAFKEAYYFSNNTDSHQIFHKLVNEIISDTLTYDEAVKLAEEIARDGVLVNLYEEGIK